MDKENLDMRIWELRAPLLRVAGGILRHTQNAEDAESAAIVTAYQKLDTLRNEESLRPWLTRITVRCCYDLLKKSRREQPSMEPAEAEAPLFVSDIRDTLYSALESMPAGMARVLLLYYYEGFSTVEIADALGMSRPAVSTRLMRGRKKLKELLLEEQMRAEGVEAHEQPNL